MSPTGAFSLSIRDVTPEHGDVVKHYKIRTLDKGGYYISPSLTFSSLQELIQHYSSESNDPQDTQTVICTVIGLSFFHQSYFLFITAVIMNSFSFFFFSNFQVQLYNGIAVPLTVIHCSERIYQTSDLFSLRPSSQLPSTLPDMPLNVSAFFSSSSFFFKPPDKQRSTSLT